MADEEVDYKPAKEESIQDILKKDSADESLRKYKEQLLGAAAKGVPDTKDPRRVVIKKFGLVFPNKEHEPVMRELDTQEKLDALAKNPIAVKEGVDYQFFVEFNIQHDIVAALKFNNTVSKAVFSDKSTFVVGSFAPRVEPYQWKSPVQTAPSGMLARGKFNCVTKFVDDDKKQHLELKYTLEIKSNW